MINRAAQIFSAFCAGVALSSWMHVYWAHQAEAREQANIVPIVCDDPVIDKKHHTEIVDCHPDAIKSRIPAKDVKST